MKNHSWNAVVKVTKGFRPFYARIKGQNNRSIEELYQGAKRFEDGSTNLSIKQAKGRQAVNQQACAIYYDDLWQELLKSKKTKFVDRKV